jgi:hypothetical protein
MEDKSSSQREQQHLLSMLVVALSYELLWCNTSCWLQACFCSTHNVKCICVQTLEIPPAHTRPRSSPAFALAVHACPWHAQTPVTAASHHTHSHCCLGLLAVTAECAVLERVNTSPAGRGFVNYLTILRWLRLLRGCAIGGEARAARLRGAGSSNVNDVTFVAVRRAGEWKMKTPGGK